jgi:hypothetical protein
MFICLIFSQLLAGQEQLKILGGPTKEMTNEPPTWRQSTHKGAVDRGLCPQPLVAIHTIYGGIYIHVYVHVLENYTYTVRSLHHWIRIYSANVPQ